MNILSLIQAQGSTSTKGGLSKEAAPSSNSFDDIVKSEQHQPNSLNNPVDGNKIVANDKILNEPMVVATMMPGQNVASIMELMADNQHMSIENPISDLSQQNVSNMIIASSEIQDQITLEPKRLDQDPTLASMAGGNYAMPVVANIVTPQSINFEHQIDSSPKVNNIANDNSLLSNFINPVQAEGQAPAPVVENNLPTGVEFQQEIANVTPLNEMSNKINLAVAQSQNNDRENITDENTILPPEEAVLSPEITSQPKYYSKNEESMNHRDSNDFDKNLEISIDDSQKPKYQEDTSSHIDDNQAGALANNNAKIQLPNQEVKLYEAQSNLITKDYDEVQVTVSSYVKDGNKINVQLHPAELGKIDIRLELSDKGNHISIIADKAQTLEMLQKDARNLEKVLNDVGVGADSSTMSFSLSHGNSEKNNDPKQSGLTKFFNDNKEIIEESTLFVKNNYISTSGIDIRI
jgi:flagellar hook-length control protein FliK